MKSIFTLLAAVLLAACTTTGPSDGGRLELYMHHAGEPVNQILYRDAMGWERIDGTHVLLSMRPRESWLLRLPVSCLDWGGGSPFLTVSSQTGWLLSKFDSVKVSGSPVTCRIEEIRRVDIPGVRADEKQLRDQVVSGT